MKKLIQNIDIVKLEKEIFINKKPILGICVGMQLMAENGNEFGKTKGLGWIKGNVELINSSGLSLPHIGWNSVRVKQENQILKKSDLDKDFYFVNSFFFDASNSKNIIATTKYGIEFPSIVAMDNVFGVQFHPEKSQLPGRRLISDFYKIS